MFFSQKTKLQICFITIVYLATSVQCQRPPSRNSLNQRRNGMAPGLHTQPDLSGYYKRRAPQPYPDIYGQSAHWYKGLKTHPYKPVGSFSNPQLAATSLNMQKYKPYVPHYKRYVPQRYRGSALKPEVVTPLKPIRPKPVAYPSHMWEKPAVQGIQGIDQTMSIYQQPTFKKPYAAKYPTFETNAIPTDFKYVQPQLNVAHVKPSPPAVLPLETPQSFNEDKGPIHTIPAPNLSLGGHGGHHHKPIVVADTPSKTYQYSSVQFGTENTQQSSNRNPYSVVEYQYNSNIDPLTGRQKYYAPDPDPKSNQNQNQNQGLGSYGQSFPAYSQQVHQNYGDVAQIQNPTQQQSNSQLLNYFQTPFNSQGIANNYAVPIQNTISFQDNIAIPAVPVMPVYKAPLLPIASLPQSQNEVDSNSQYSNQQPTFGNFQTWSLNGPADQSISNFESMKTDGGSQGDQTNQANTNFLRPNFVSFNYNEQTKDDSVSAGSQPMGMFVQPMSNADQAYFELLNQINNNKDQQSYFTENEDRKDDGLKDSQRVASRNTAESFVSNLEAEKPENDQVFGTSNIESMISNLHKNVNFVAPNMEPFDASSIYEQIIGKQGGNTTPLSQEDPTGNQGDNEIPNLQNRGDEDSDLFHYTVLPNKKAAETLAKLQAAGELLSRHVNKLDDGKKNETEDKTEQLIAKAQSALTSEDDYHYDDGKVDEDYEDTVNNKNVTDNVNVATTISSVNKE